VYLREYCREIFEEQLDGRFVDGHSKTGSPETLANL
jgi:hypothetical protein